MIRDSEFTQHCKLTCLGGSEHGTCECESPAGCALQKHPNFPRARAEATERFRRLFFVNADTEAGQ